MVGLMTPHGWPSDPRRIVAHRQGKGRMDHERAALTLIRVGTMTPQVGPMTPPCFGRAGGGRRFPAPSDAAVGRPPNIGVPLVHGYSCATMTLCRRKHP